MTAPPPLTRDQQAAVLFTEGDSSILAGAGSGKTTVLVEKIALLVEKIHVPLEQILIVTFTEKAAAEIRSRIAKRLGLSEDAAARLAAGTLHASAALLLRDRADALGLPPDFRIMSEHLADLDRLRCCREGILEAVEDRFPGAIPCIEHFGLRGAVRFLISVRPHGQWTDAKVGGKP